MTFRNYTPFPQLIFESRDEQKRDFGVLVLRGTFEILPGMPLKPIPEQEPIVMADQYHGEPGKSSLRLENNLAPYKPRADIHLDAVAHAPGGKPRTNWRVGVEVGRLKKEMAVSGPRFWHKSHVGWNLSDPVPVAQVPLRYESAYGGSWQHEQEVGIFSQNPVGAGFVNQKVLGDSKMIPAPSILAADGLVPEMNKEMKVEGLGPIAPSWQPRLKFAGTFDSKWERTRWPDLPEDFKFDFYNSAHPDLIYPGFLQGNETVRLTNLGPSAELAFTLPDYLVGMLHRFEDGQLVPAPMQLDTVHFELAKMRAYLVWRGLYPVNKPMRVLEARIKLHASQVRPSLPHET